MAEIQRLNGSELAMGYWSLAIAPQAPRRKGRRGIDFRKKQSTVQRTVAATLDLLAFTALRHGVKKWNEANLKSLE